jgi:ribonuclease HI
VQLEAEVNVSKLVIACDASCIVPKSNEKGRTGKGKSACGILFMDGMKSLTATIEQKCVYLGEMTVPEAEYNAIIVALDHASSICRKDVELWSDSELAIRHLNGQYRLKATNLKPLFDRVKALEKRYEKVSYLHHSRNNDVAKRVDEIASQCARDNS